ncbi:HupE/UreJ family protein [Dactylosporangium sp. CS-047395]|uniref:HupE/UreJ family protein n=1 Tax=Dactylosporangium sp. CS-047395 TaxID=3239936 RepID=UPI003D90B48E
MSRRLLLLVLAALCGAVPVPGRAVAHPMPHSIVTLDPRGATVAASLQVPVEDLALASGVGPADLEGLRRYLHDHLHPRALDGTPWTVAIGAVTVTGDEQADTGPYRELRADAVLTPPPGAGTGRFTLGYDAVVHQVVTHTVFVASRSGDALGVIAVDPRTMAVPDLTVTLDRHRSSFPAMLGLGARHIVEGTDHLLFLLVLLIPAAFRARSGRTAFRRIGAVTLAFTAGHSIALAVSALTRLELPARPVEAAIAVTILVGAGHAARPLFPDREPLIAGLFGLVHGLAFAFTLAELHLSAGSLIVSLLGFNLGIELVQLLLVALALPALLVAARSRHRRAVRLAGAALAAVAATGWLADRLGFPNPVARAADTAGAHPAFLVGALVLTAAVPLIAGRRGRLSAATTRR